MKTTNEGKIGRFSIMDFLGIVAKGKLYQGVVNSNRMLVKAMQHLHQLDRHPDVVMVSGDVVNEGRPDEYAITRKQLSEHHIPYLNWLEQTLLSTRIKPTVVGTRCSWTQTNTSRIHTVACLPIVTLNLSIEPAISRTAYLH